MTQTIWYQILINTNKLQKLENVLEKFKKSSNNFWIFFETVTL